VKALDRAEVASFLDFYLTKGAALVREVGYIPLTDREYDLVRARLKSRTAGSMYTEADAHAQISLEQRLSK